jgi:Pectate lyase superfamily protein
MFFKHLVNHLVFTSCFVFVSLLTVRVASATCDVTGFGATGNGSTDDRAAIQAAIDACASSGDRDVYFPSGTYSLTRSGSAFYNLLVSSGIRLRGASQAGVVLKQAAGMAGSVRILQITGDDVHVENLTLDGNKASQTADEHRSGIFATATNRLVVQQVTAQNFTGDGFYLYVAANHSTLRDVYATGNDRNGVTLGASLTGAVLIGSRFIGNRAQQVDSEPGAGNTVNNVAITGCTIDGAGVSNDYALTVSGSGSSSRSYGWSVVGNTINGGIFIVWTDGVLVSANKGINPTTKASVTVYRKSTNVSIVGNDFRLTQTSVISLGGISIIGTGVGDTPERVVVSDNSIKLDYASSFGVLAQGAISVAIVHNHLRGAGTSAATYGGVYLRATSAIEDFRSAIVSGNTISDFGQFGVQVHGNGAARLLSLDISGNLFDDDSTTPSMTTGIRLDDGTGAAKQISLVGNQCLGGVATPVANYPVGAVVLIGGTRGAIPMYSVSGTPEGQVTAAVGATATRRDGGVGTTYYVKETGTGATGWVAK